MDTNVNPRNARVKTRNAVVTYDEICDRLGIGVNQARAAAKRGDFPAVRLGRRLIVPRAAFERWLENGGKSVA